MPARKGSELGRWIRGRRDELDLSLSQIQVRTQGAVGASYLSRIEREGRVPGPEVLLALAPVLRVSAEFLYKLAGYLPTTTQAAEPEPPKAVSWPEIERMILESSDLTLQQRRDLISVWRPQYEAMAQGATDRKRRAPRKASG